jgi:radical SAM protein with 4Fe4S-binding SPASM domain
LASLETGRPEKWRILTVDKQRWNEFKWKRIIWIAVNSTYETPEQLIKSAMSVLDSLAFPLNMLANRYEYAIESVCVEVSVRFGLVMQFIRAQTKANAREMAGEAIGNEEKDVRDAWVAEGMTMDSYRSFALQIFQVRQERDPPFVLMVFRSKPEKLVIIWFRDIHLASGPYYKALFPATVEHLYWPNYTHKPLLDPPIQTCERASCSNKSGMTTDVNLLATFEKHVGPYQKEGKSLVDAEMKKVWKEQFQPQIDGARKEMEGKMDAEELKIAIEKMEGDLKEQIDEKEADIRKKIEAKRVTAFKRCGRCKLVHYCSASCQKEDWGRLHSRFCKSKE